MLIHRQCVSGPSVVHVGSYSNNENKSSQRAHTIFLAEPRDRTRVSEFTRGSLVDGSHKITATTMSTTVAELHGSAHVNTFVVYGQMFQVMLPKSTSERMLTIW